MTDSLKIEVFGKPSEFAINSLGKTEPHVWNNRVNVKRYRITIEEIVEPKEILKDRLLQLLNQPGHISHPYIRDEAKRLGIELATEEKL